MRGLSVFAVALAFAACTSVEHDRGAGALEPGFVLPAGEHPLRQVLFRAEEFLETRFCLEEADFRRSSTVSVLQELRIPAQGCLGFVDHVAYRLDYAVIPRDDTYQIVCIRSPKTRRPAYQVDMVGTGDLFIGSIGQEESVVVVGSLRSVSEALGARSRVDAMANKQ